MSVVWLNAITVGLARREEEEREAARAREDAWSAPMDAFLEHLMTLDYGTVDALYYGPVDPYDCRDRGLHPIEWKKVIERAWEEKNTRGA